MPKSTLSTNDFGNNHFGQKYSSDFIQCDIFLCISQLQARMTSGTIILDKSTVVILINATTLMHKSTLSTNDFENNHFGQKYSSDFN